MAKLNKFLVARGVSHHWDICLYKGASFFLKSILNSETFFLLKVLAYLRTHHSSSFSSFQDLYRLGFFPGFLFFSSSIFSQRSWGPVDSFLPIGSFFFLHLNPLEPFTMVRVLEVPAIARASIFGRTFCKSFQKFLNLDRGRKSKTFVLLRLKVF